MSKVNDYDYNKMIEEFRMEDLRDKERTSQVRVY